MKARFWRICIYNWFAFLIIACGTAEALIEVSVNSEQAVRVPSEKALGDPVPVHRFAKISNGAYFYTANQAEFENVVNNYPDFRYEGVAFQASAAGGTPVFRYAKTDTGAYFYTTSVEEKAVIAANYPNFRYEGEVFNVPASGGAPMYRLANLSNGAYLYTASLEEYNYAQTVGFRGEGQKFEVPAGLLLSGTVFKEVAWKQANVKVVDFNRATKDTVTNNLGGYSVDITGMQSPIYVIASYKTPGAISDYMVAALPTLPSNATAATANVTPLTHLVQIYSNPVEAYVLAFNVTSIARPLPAAKVAAANQAIRTVLARQLGANGLQASNFDPTKLPFAANGIGQAALLRDTTVNFVNYLGKSWITNNLTGEFATGSVLLTTAAIDSASAPSLPLATKQPFPAAKLIAFKDAWNTCLTIPVASRITVSNNEVVAIHPSCAAIATPDYLLNGENFGQRWRSLLGEPSFVGGSIESVSMRDYADIDGNELAGIYIRALSNDGKPFNSLEVFRKINGNWEVAGNNRIYTGTVTARYSNYKRLENGTSTEIDRYRPDIQFSANPGHPSMANIRAIRVRGPGIPAAGLVFTRSVVCGTSDYMTINSRDGVVVDTDPATGAITGERVWTNNSSPTFNLSQIFLTGSGTWPTANRNFADNNLLNPEDVVPPGSRYIIEYFAFQPTPSTTPVATYTSTLNGTVMNVRVSGNNAAYVTLTRGASLTPAFINDFLSATSANVGQRTSVPVSWTRGPGSFAGSVTDAFGYSTSRNVAQTDSAKSDYLFIAQGGSTPWLVSGALSANVSFNMSDLANGVSTHPISQAAAGSQNTTCSTMPAAFRGLNENTGYREMTIRSSSANFTRIQTAVGIQN